MANIFRFPGSKRRLLPVLDTYLRPHLHSGSSYHSCFVGGGSDLLHVARNHPHVRLCANDLDGCIADTWRVVVGPEEDLEALEERILETTPTLALRDEIKHQHPEDRVGRAFQAIFVNRTSFSGIWSAGPLGGRGQKGQTNIDDRWRPEKIVVALREARDLLLGRLQVASMDAVAYVTCMLEEDPDGLYYLDPPYWHQGWQLYREQMTSGDHERLAGVLRGVPRFVLSYDLCPEVEALYSWASIEEVEIIYTTATATEAKRARRGEVVITPLHDGGVNVSRKNHAHESTQSCPAGARSPDADRRLDTRSA
jgi:DNA adenine methylase